MKTRTRQVVCWLEPQFDVLDLAAFCQTLSMAGSNWNWRPFRVTLASRDGGLIESRAQLSVNTVPLSECSVPAVVVLAGGADAGTPFTNDAQPDNHPLALWAKERVFWVVLRRALPALVQSNLRPATLAVSPQFQPQLAAHLPTTSFSNQDFQIDGQVMSCATLDALPAALALIERELGLSARRYVEGQIGSGQSTINLKGIDALTPAKG